MFEKISIVVVIVGLCFWDKTDWLFGNMTCTQGCQHLFKPSALSLKWRTIVVWVKCNSLSEWNCDLRLTKSGWKIWVGLPERVIGFRVARESNCLSVIMSCERPRVKGERRSRVSLRERDHLTIVEICERWRTLCVLILELWWQLNKGL